MLTRSAANYIIAKRACTKYVADPNGHQVFEKFIWR